MKFALSKWILFAGFAYLAAQSARALNDIAWGSGAWLGEYSPLWALIFIGYIFLCLTLTILFAILILRKEKIDFILNALARARNALGWLRLPLAAFILLALIWLLQATGWGLVFRAAALRNMTALLVVLLLAALWTKGGELLTWQAFFAALAVAAGVFTIAYTFLNVSGYPFALGWSEGNRLWDYSVLFGRERYLYPADQSIPVLLDVGRQFIGGVIFLYKKSDIRTARIWVSLTQVLPYLLLGCALFCKEKKNKALFLILTLWTLLFVKQGPIHPPLAVSAALAALAWNAPLAAAAALVFAAGIVTQTSRLTWAFAPPIWIVMLEFAGSDWTSPEVIRRAWRRSVILGVAGLLSIAAVLFLLKASPAAVELFRNTGYQAPAQEPAQPQAASTLPEESPSLIESAIQIVKAQPLLWYRLLPNSTYQTGILLALFIAVAPLVAFLIYLIRQKIWSVSLWQAAALLLPTLVFLLIGLAASAKIGGGGDLHNLDMFLISLMFISAIAWKNGGGEWMKNLSHLPDGLKFLLLLMLYLPASGALHSIRPLELDGDVKWVATLTDRRVDELPLLPSREVQNRALQKIQDAVAQAQGEVLFLDQRQLLTFGYVPNVPLVPEYEKKMLMNEAMSEHADYFANFYADLAAQRFSLIVTEPIRKPAKGSEFQFGEENNAWVKWVSLPVLCYYQEEDWMKEVGVQLLTPIQNPAPCADLPIQGK